jgi:biopolymer transport protein ExbB
LLSIIQAAGWPIWPLIACSVVGLALIIERTVHLQAARVVPPGVLDQAMQATRGGMPSPEALHQMAQSSVLGGVLAAGIQALLDDRQASEAYVRAQLEAAGRLAAAQLQRHLGGLATIASAAPLIGLLGTVIGMIEIFGSQAAAGGLTPGGGNPEQLARGISIALYNTAFGLIVAIPCLIGWRYFRARVDAYLLQMEVGAERFTHHLLQQRA